MLAHYCLHELKMLPSTFNNLPREEKALITASIKIKVEDERKAYEKAQRK